jgi:flagellar FliL protein
MATAGAAADAPAKGGGMKKLIIIIAAVAVVVVAGGVGLLLMLNKSAKAEDEAAGGGDETHAPAKKHEVKKGETPVFVPLEPFTVNLSDKEVDRFAQIGVTLQVADAHAAEEIKAYLPAIRSNVLVLLSHKTSVELLSAEGKEKLAREVLRESVRPLGFDIETDEDEDPAAPKKKKKKSRVSEADLPITQVLFSSFIVQ